MGLCAIIALILTGRLRDRRAGSWDDQDRSDDCDESITDYAVTGRRPTSWVILPASSNCSARGSICTDRPEDFLIQPPTEVDPCGLSAPNRHTDADSDGNTDGDHHSDSRRHTPTAHADSNTD